MVTEGFRLEQALGEGGFGIMYLTWDPALDKHGAIKAYMPVSLALRAGDEATVDLRSELDRPTFDAGLRSFVNEASLLARFDHPSLVKVLRIWEDNGTAYMALPHCEDPTPKASLPAAADAVTEAQLLSWLEPLLDALSVLHQENCDHRDVAPHKILPIGSGPVLLDFGVRAARSRTGPRCPRPLKPGFATIEQYGSEVMQGPWTDLHALAGVVPDMQPRLSMTEAHLSARFLAAMDVALSVGPFA